MEGSTPKKSVPAGLIAGLITAALSAVLVGGYFGLCSWVQTNDRLLPGAVAVDDRGETVADLGKLSREDALAALTREMDQRLDRRKLTIYYGSGQQAVLSGDLMACAPEAAVDVGMAAKEEQPFWRLAALWLGLDQAPTRLSLSAAAFTPEGEAEAKRVAQSIADALYAPPTDFTYELGEETVTVIPGRDGQELDARVLLDAVEKALTEGETELTVVPQPIPAPQLSGKMLSELIRVEPQPARLDENNKLVPAVMGLSVNADQAQSILDQATPGEPCVIPLEFIQPDTSGDEALYYHDLLAEVTTNLDGVATRSFNVGRAASFCNEKILQPGDVFSYLDTIGDPSAANGYQTSTGYYNGETVPMDGGGVCQVSSSLYYCAVYSNLEIVNRACHAFATGYIPNGLDATVYYPGLDFKFRNNTGFPIKIVAYTSGGAWGQLTVQFYGSNPDGISVKTDRYLLSSTPWETVYEPDETIEPGTTTVKTTPYTGYEVDVYRCVYDAGGELISRTYENHSRYAKRDKVILYNPADAAALGLEPLEPVVTDPPVEPSADPWVQPSQEPIPSADPWVQPSQEPIPSTDPWAQPSQEPTASVDPWAQPSQDPAAPTDPWAQPSQDPWVQPSQYIDLPAPEVTPAPDPNVGQFGW